MRIPLLFLFSASFLAASSSLPGAACSSSSSSAGYQPNGNSSVSFASAPQVQTTTAPLPLFVADLSPLTMAVMHRDLKTVEYLLYEARVDPSAASFSALHAAINSFYGNPDILRHFVYHDKVPKFKVLFYATLTRNLVALRWLFEQPIFDTFDSKLKVLVRAARRGYVEVVDYVLNLPDFPLTYLPLFLTHLTDNDKVKALLLDHIQVHPKTPHGFLLGAVIESGNYHAVGWLLRHPNLNLRVDGHFALRMAIRKRHMGIVEDILTLHDVELNMPAFELGSPLFHAVESGQMEFVERIVNYGRFQVVEEEIAKARLMAHQMGYWAIYNFLENVTPREGLPSSATNAGVYPLFMEDFQLRRDALLAMIESVLLKSSLNSHYDLILGALEGTFARLFEEDEIPAPLEDPAQRPVAYDYLKLTFEDLQMAYPNFHLDAQKATFKDFVIGTLIAEVQKECMQRNWQKGEDRQANPNDTIPMPVFGDAIPSTANSHQQQFVPMEAPFRVQVLPPQPRPTKRRRLQNIDDGGEQEPVAASDTRGDADGKHPEARPSSGDHLYHHTLFGKFLELVDLAADDPGNSNQ